MKTLSQICNLKENVDTLVLNTSAAERAIQSMLNKVLPIKSVKIKKAKEGYSLAIELKMALESNKPSVSAKIFFQVRLQKNVSEIINSVLKMQGYFLNYVDLFDEHNLHGEILFNKDTFIEKIVTDIQGKKYELENFKDYDGDFAYVYSKGLKFNSDSLVHTDKIFYNGKSVRYWLHTL